MSRLIKLAIGDIQKSDIQITDDGSTLKVHLINKEKYKELKHWNFSVPIQNEENLIGFLTYVIKDSTLSVGIFEINEAYKKTSVAGFVMNEFQLKIIDPLREQYGDKFILRSLVVNIKLKKFLTLYCKKNNINFDLGNAIPDAQIERLELNTLFTNKDHNYVTNILNLRNASFYINIDGSYDIYTGDIAEQYLTQKNYLVVADNITKSAYYKNIDSVKQYISSDEMFCLCRNFYISKDNTLTSLNKSNYDAYENMSMSQFEHELISENILPSYSVTTRDPNDPSIFYVDGRRGRVLDSGEEVFDDEMNQTANIKKRLIVKY
jgi:hypothetical protein